MAEYDLPPGPRELFAATYPALAKFFGPRNLQLGGGTALVMRWRHRHSIDVDLFVAPAVYEPVYRRPDSLLQELEKVSLGIEELGVWPSWSRFRFDEGGVSVMGRPFLTPEPRSHDTVRGTEVVLETTAEILAKKLGPRMIGSEVYVPRDVYDLACARVFEPEALRTALTWIHPNYRRDVREKLRLLPTGWMENHPNKVLAPSRPDELPRAVDVVRQLLTASLEPPERGSDGDMDR